jgi:6-phosphogluconate dehydrogenase
MQVGVIDLGRVGAHVTRRLLAAGHRCVVFDRSPTRVAELAAERAFGAASLADLANELDVPRAICLTGPPRETDATIRELQQWLSADDVLVNFADSSYVEDLLRARSLAAQGVQYVDVGMRGRLGPSGDMQCFTIGGEEAAVVRLDPIFRALLAGAPEPPENECVTSTSPTGVLHCGSVGAGHFVSMVLSSIERCLVSAYGEGFDILRAAHDGASAGSVVAGAAGAARYAYEFTLTDFAEVWQHGTLVSAVLDLTARVLSTRTALQASAGRRRLIDEWPAIRTAVDEAMPILRLASDVSRVAEAPPVDVPIASRAAHNTGRAVESQTPTRRAARSEAAV